MNKVGTFYYLDGEELTNEQVEREIRTNRELVKGGILLREPEHQKALVELLKVSRSSDGTERHQYTTGVPRLMLRTYSTMYSKKVYSAAHGYCVATGFTFSGKHYTWNEQEEVYRCDTEDDYFIEIPNVATTLDLE